MICVSHQLADLEGRNFHGGQSYGRYFRGIHFYDFAPNFVLETNQKIKFCRCFLMGTNRKTKFYRFLCDMNL